jgi:hypothetical protein
VPPAHEVEHLVPTLRVLRQVYETIWAFFFLLVRVASSAPRAAETTPPLSVRTMHPQ